MCKSIPMQITSAKPPLDHSSHKVPVSFPGSPVSERGESSRSVFSRLLSVGGGGGGRNENPHASPTAASGKRDRVLPGSSSALLPETPIHLNARDKPVTESGAAGFLPGGRPGSGASAKAAAKGRRLKVTPAPRQPFPGDTSESGHVLAAERANPAAAAAGLAGRGADPRLRSPRRRAVPRRPASVGGPASENRGPCGRRGRKQHGGARSDSWEPSSSPSAPQQGNRAALGARDEQGAEEKARAAPRRPAAPPRRTCRPLLARWRPPPHSHAGPAPSRRPRPGGAAASPRPPRRLDSAEPGRSADRPARPRRSPGP